MGIWSAPDGNNKDQIAHMRSIAIEWGDKLWEGHLTKYEAWMALNTLVMKTLLYAALAITITNADANHVMAPILMSGLSLQTQNYNHGSSG